MLCVGEAQGCGLGGSVPLGEEMAPGPAYLPQGPFWFSRGLRGEDMDGGGRDRC